VISKGLKNMVITKLIHPGQLSSIYRSAAKTKVKGFFGMSSCNISQFTKAVAAIQLTEHKNQQLVPVGQTPLLGFIITTFHGKSFKVSLGKKIGDLTEDILAIVHRTLLLWLPAKVASSKVRQWF